MRVPQTPTGRRLNDYLVRSIVTTDERRAAFTADILAIEAEASALDVERLGHAIARWVAVTDAAQPLEDVVSSEAAVDIAAEYVALGEPMP